MPPSIVERLRALKEKHGLTWHILLDEIYRGTGIKLGQSTVDIWAAGKRGKAVQPHPARVYLLEHFCRRYPHGVPLDLDYATGDPLPRLRALKIRLTKHYGRKIEWGEIWRRMRKDKGTFMARITFNLWSEGGKRNISKEERLLIHTWCRDMEKRLARPPRHKPGPKPKPKEPKPLKGEV